MYATNNHIVATHPRLVARLRQLPQHHEMVDRLARERGLGVKERRELQTAIEAEYCIRVARLVEARRAGL